jgi:hypothetical protein
MPRYPADKPINVEVTVPQGQGIEVTKAGVKFRERRPDILSRKKKGGLINFWDLGQISDGSSGWLDIDFESVPVPVPGYVQYEPIPSVDVLALNDTWLDVPIDNWETTFRKLEFEPAERYGLDLYVSPDEIYPVGRNNSRYITTVRELIHDTTWTDKGLEVPASFTTMFFLSYCSFNNWFMGMSNSTTRFKWTSINDFSGPDVGEQTIEKSAKIFLTPRIMDVHIDATGAMSKFHYMICNYRAYQRGFWLDKNYQDTQIGLLTDPLAEVSLMSLTDVDKVAMVEDYRPHAVSVDDTGFLPDASTWPEVNSSITAYLGQNNAMLPSPSAAYVPGQLIAVVKQKNSVFYIWCRNADGFVQERVFGLTGLY